MWARMWTTISSACAASVRLPIRTRQATRALRGGESGPLAQSMSVFRTRSVGGSPTKEGRRLESIHAVHRRRELGSTIVRGRCRTPSDARVPISCTRQRRRLLSIDGRPRASQLAAQLRALRDNPNQHCQSSGRGLRDPVGDSSISERLTPARGKEAAMFDIPGITGLLALALFATWVATRARRDNRRLVKWVGLVLSSVITLACTLAIGVALVGFYKINFPPHRPAVTELRVAGTPDQVARGARFGAFCALCHSPNANVPLVGADFTRGGPPVGTMFATNLTPAGEIKNWSDAEVIRAIREGVHKSGRALVIMPSEVFHNLSDVDVQAIVAYLRSQPAAGPNTPATKLNVVGALFIGAGLAPTSAQPPITQPIVAPAGRRLGRLRQVPGLDSGLPTVPWRKPRGPHQRRAWPTRRPKPHGDRPEVECRGLQPYPAHGCGSLHPHANARGCHGSRFPASQVTRISRRSIPTYTA